MFEAVCPGIAFVLVYTIWRLLPLAVGVSLLVLAVFACWRLIEGSTLAQILTGLLGVVISFGLALVTGRASNNYLPGLIANFGTVLLLGASLLARWPLIGVALGLWRSEPRLCRESRLVFRATAAATSVWLVISAVRLAVQLPLYLSSLQHGGIVGLGVAKLLMGLPLFAVGVLITWMLLRPVIIVLDEQKAVQNQPPADGAS